VALLLLLHLLIHLLLAPLVIAPQLQYNRKRHSPHTYSAEVGNEVKQQSPKWHPLDSDNCSKETCYPPPPPVYGTQHIRIKLPINTALHVPFHTFNLLQPHSHQAALHSLAHCCQEHHESWGAKSAIHSHKVSDLLRWTSPVTVNVSVVPGMALYCSLELTDSSTATAIASFQVVHSQRPADSWVACSTAKQTHRDSAALMPSREQGNKLVNHRCFNEGPAEQLYNQLGLRQVRTNNQHICLMHQHVSLRCLTCCSG
jgi:hypothetical protein